MKAAHQLVGEDVDGELPSSAPRAKTTGRGNIWRHEQHVTASRRTSRSSCRLHFSTCLFRVSRTWMGALLENPIVTSRGADERLYGVKRTSLDEDGLGQGLCHDRTFPTSVDATSAVSQRLPGDTTYPSAYPAPLPYVSKSTAHGPISRLKLVLAQCLPLGIAASTSAEHEIGPK